MPETLRALASRLTASYDADFRENSNNAAASCDPSNRQRTTNPLNACAHTDVLTE